MVAQDLQCGCTKDLDYIYGVAVILLMGQMLRACIGSKFTPTDGYVYVTHGLYIGWLLEIECKW